jgi:hypothetical protein
MAELFHLALLLMPRICRIAKLISHILLKLGVLMLGFNMVFVELILD